MHSGTEREVRFDGEHEISKARLGSPPSTSSISAPRQGVYDGFLRTGRAVHQSRWNAAGVRPGAIRGYGAWEGVCAVPARGWRGSLRPESDGWRTHIRGLSSCPAMSARPKNPRRADDTVLRRPDHNARRLRRSVHCWRKPAPWSGLAPGDIARRPCATHPPRPPLSPRKSQELQGE